MKRKGSILIFALFGVSSEAFLLMLLGQMDFARHVFSFLLATLSFVAYRVFIEERKQSECVKEKEQGSREGYLRLELRRWWLRREPENTFAFAILGGMALVLCNGPLWQHSRLIDVWAMGFVSVGLTQVAFEQMRVAWNRLYAYFAHKMKVRRMERIMEVRKAHGLGKVAYPGSH